MYAFGRFSLGLNYPRYKALRNASAAAALSVAVAGAANQTHAASGYVPVRFAVSVSSALKRHGKATTGTSVALYGNAYVKRAGKGVPVAFDLLLTGHVLNFPQGAGVTGISFGMTGVAAGVLANGSTSLTTGITGVGTRKSYRSGAVSFSGSMTGAATMKRGGFALASSVALLAHGALKLKKSGETFWRHDAHAAPQLNVTLDTMSSGVVLKALGGKIAAANYTMTASPYLKRYGAGSSGLAMEVIPGQTRKTYGAGIPSLAFQVQTQGTRKRAGTTATGFAVGISASMVQQHAASGALMANMTMAGSGNPRHGGSGRCALSFAVVGRMHQRLPAVGAATMAFSFSGLGGRKVYADGAASVGFSLHGNAMQNLGVDAPEWRTALLPYEMRAAYLLPEPRTMELTR